MATVDSLVATLESLGHRRAMQRKTLVEKAAAELYFAALKYREDGIPWPRRLDDAHRLLWEDLERDEVFRRELVGPVGEEDADAG